jgi:hypothetical protein
MECKGHNSDRYKVGGEVATTTGVTTVTKIELSWVDNSAKGKQRKGGLIRALDPRHPRR